MVRNVALRVVTSGKEILLCLYGMFYILLLPEHPA